MVIHFTLRHPMKKGRADNFVWGALETGVDQPMLNIVLNKRGSDGSEEITANVRLAYDGERVYVVVKDDGRTQVVKLMETTDESEE